MTGRPRLAQVLASPTMLAVLVLGAASGFPNQITESVLQAWLKDSGASNTLIGAMSYVSLPYLLKPLWAPFTDRYTAPFLGRRRSWMLLTQVALAAGIVVLGLQDPRLALAPVFICALVIVFFSATQDIAIDAWRTDVTSPSERGLSAAATQLGYRSAAWIASAMALLLADYFGWRLAFAILAVVMLAFCIATVKAPEAAAQYKPRTLRESIVEPLRELFGTPGAASLILVVLLFKVGDAFANKLFTPFMMDVGFSKSEIALIVKVLFTASTLVGSVVGGVLMVRLGLWRSMLVFGVLQALTNLLYCVLALSGKSYPIMVLAVVVEHFAGAMGAMALVALIMALCDIRYSAFQYALLSALALLPRYSLGLPAGWVADHEGWYGYFVVSFLLAFPGLAVVWAQRRRISALDTSQGLSQRA